MPAREVAVLIEDLRSQFRAFGEGLKALSDKTDGIAANQAVTLEKVAGLEIKVAGLEVITKRIQADVAEIKTNLQSHAQRLTRLETVSPD